MPEHLPSPGVQPETAPAIYRDVAGLTIEYVPRNLKMLRISTSELDSVASLGASIHMGFLGISIGALVAFAITLATVQILDPVLHASFVGLTWVTGVLSLYFGIRAMSDYLSARRKLRAIKDGAA